MGTPPACGPNGPNFLDFMRFFGKFWQNLMLAPPGGLATLPTGNPGSAPDFHSVFRKKLDQNCRLGTWLSGLTLSFCKILGATESLSLVPPSRTEKQRTSSPLTSTKQGWPNPWSSLPSRPHSPRGPPIDTGSWNTDQVCTRSWIQNFSPGAVNPSGVQDLVNGNCTFLEKIWQTRMHSSRMRTIRCSIHLGGGVVCLRGCLPREGCLPGGCQPTRCTTP